MKKCAKCCEFKGEVSFMMDSKIFSTCVKCVIERREKALEERRKKYGDGRVCPQCKELKFDFEYRIINKKYPRFSTNCIECLIANEQKQKEATKRYFDYVNYGLTY